MLLSRLNAVEKSLKTEKEKVRTLEKEIDELKERRKDGVKAREDLVIAIFGNVIKLSNLPFRRGWIGTGGFLSLSHHY
jgi:hypothetical protein